MQRAGRAGRGAAAAAEGKRGVEDVLGGDAGSCGAAPEGVGVRAELPQLGGAGRRRRLEGSDGERRAARAEEALVLERRAKPGVVRRTLLRLASVEGREEGGDAAGGSVL